MRWLGLWFALMLAGCVSPVVIDHRDGTNFSHYHSYAITPLGGKNHTISLDDQRVRQALVPALAGAGLKPCKAGQADLLVRYHFNPVAHFQGNAFQFGFGFWHRNLGFGAETPVEGETVREDKLQVVMVERDSNQVIWQATSRGTLAPDMSSEERTSRIKTMIQDMFQRYPPEGTPAGADQN